MLVHQVAVDVGVDLEVVPALGVVFHVVVAVGELGRGGLESDGIVGLQGVKCAVDRPEHEGDY